jgi:hypothetical protein
LRGVGANIIYCEEAAFMDMRVFYEVIVPCCEVKDTALIMISTPQGRWNFYSELLSTKDEHGNDFFNVVRVGNACARCIEEEKEETCRHPCENRPSWKPDENYKKMEAMYGERVMLFRREILGQVDDGDNTAFDQDRLQDWFTSPPAREPHSRIDTVYVGFDPNGGIKSATSGGGSQTAIVSLCYDGGNVMVRVCSLSVIVRVRACAREMIIAAAAPPPPPPACRTPTRAECVPSPP